MTKAWRTAARVPLRAFHIVEGARFRLCLLIKYGGHPMAAGFTVAADQIEELRWRLNRYAAERLKDEDLGRAFTADAELPFEEVNYSTVQALARLERTAWATPRRFF